MCDPAKIHVFLGSPPASCGDDREPGDVEDAQNRPPWRHLNLKWRGQRLQLAADFERGSAVDLTQRPETELDTLAEQVTNPEPEIGEEGECWSSVQEYLDHHFPSALPEQGPGPESAPELFPESGHALSGEPKSLPGPGLDSQPNIEQKSAPKPGPETESLSIQSQFLSTWTLSQALILKGRNIVQSVSSHERTPPTEPHTSPSVSSGTPDLFSPEPTSCEASEELFSHSGSTPMAEEGGVILHATMGGILCSQESPKKFFRESSKSPTKSSSKSPTTSLRWSPRECPKESSKSPGKLSPTKSPTKSPLRKKPRVTLESISEAPLSSAPIAPGYQRTTTFLAECDRPGSRFSILVAVVHPCHLKEIRLRSGRSAGTVVPLATIVVTDQSEVDRKVVLWRRAAFWVVTVSPGDILLVTGLQVSQDRWRGESILQSTFSTKLLNLGPITGSATTPVSPEVDVQSLASLCAFLRRRRSLLVALEPHPPQDLTRLPYATLRSLRVNMLVNAVLRVTHTYLSSAWCAEADSIRRSALQVKAVVAVEAAEGQQGTLVLWGSAVDWLPRFKTGQESLWDFRTLLVREGLTSNLPELHSTPWSSVRHLDSRDRRALDFRATQRRVQQAGTGPLELDLETLLSQKYSGDVDLRVQLVSFYFLEASNSQNPHGPVLNGSSPLDTILAVLSGDVTYVGCSRCSTELQTDDNNIYRPCYTCLPHTGVGRYYRPGVLSISGQSLSVLSLRVPPWPLQKILEAPPDQLHRSACGSGVKWLHVAAERLATLLAPRRISTVTLRSNFLLDDNGTAIHQDFTLLQLLPDNPAHT